MKEIGGYFELELNAGYEYHPDAIKLNLGRTAFEYILRAKKVKKVFLPYYTCDVMLDPVNSLRIDYEFYKVDRNLEPIFNYEMLNEADHFLYTNYFGVKDNFISQVATGIKNLIIDNSQAFYSKPLTGVDTIYSPRKFFGLPDGGYLYTKERLNSNLEQDISSERFDHLLLRIDKGAEEGYRAFLRSTDELRNQPIKAMSRLTQSLLRNINYEKARDLRKFNFNYMHYKLHGINEFKMDVTTIGTPMIYPFLCRYGEPLKKELILNKVFVATYWKNTLIRVAGDSYEDYLTNNLVPLPIDQRLEEQDLNKIVQIIVENYGK
ncbi:MAG: hypothetical protein IH594_12080 [Bacteroidales bacterium]|nr:hypothetical protein [Bacteroidales bacterium]